MVNISIINIKYQELATFYFIINRKCMTKVKMTSFFFLNQQFITRSTRADRGSYFVTTYKTTKLHEGEKEKRK